MAQLFEFVGNHWFLSAVLVALVGIFAGIEVAQRLLGAPRLNAAAVVDWINHKDAVVLDIRGDADFAKGHIANSMHMLQSEFPERIDKIEQYRDKPMILVCAMGQQSPGVGSLLRKQGFTAVYVLAGGMNRWTLDNLPVVKA